MGWAKVMIFALLFGCVPVAYIDGIRFQTLPLIKAL